MKKLKWKKMRSKFWAFHLDPEPEVLYVIEGCSSLPNGKLFIVVHEDAYGLSTGKTEILTKEEVEKKFKIKLDESQPNQI